MKHYSYYVLLICLMPLTSAEAQQRNTAPVSIELKKEGGAISRTTYEHPNARVFRQRLMELAQAGQGSAAKRQRASHTEHGEVRDFAQTYFQNGSFLVRNAFRRYLPTVATMRKLFRNPDLASELAEDYAITYGDHFHRKILDEFAHLDLRRTEVYRTTIAAFAPAHLKGELRNPNQRMLQADFFFPEDRLGLVGVHPVLTIYFIAINDQYQIFHLQALTPAKTSTR
jgi:hypothetical protein